MKMRNNTSYACSKCGDKNPKHRCDPNKKNSPKKSASKIERSN